jgi:ubiquinone/menaquinone biosynthesis C-methylase UbiE
MHSQLTNEDRQQLSQLLFEVSNSEHYSGFRHVHTDMSSWKDPNIAQRYKAAERITAAFARRLIQQVGLLEVDSGPLIVFDNACGTGVVSVKLYEMLDENAKERLQLVCGDFSESMVQSTQQRITDSRWSGAKAQMVDAQVKLHP